MPSAAARIAPPGSPPPAPRGALRQGPPPRRPATGPPSPSQEHGAAKPGPPPQPQLQEHSAATLVSPPQGARASASAAAAAPAAAAPAAAAAGARRSEAGPAAAAAAAGARRGHAGLSSAEPPAEPPLPPAPGPGASRQQLAEAFAARGVLTLPEGFAPGSQYRWDCVMEFMEQLHDKVFPWLVERLEELRHIWSADIDRVRAGKRAAELVDAALAKEHPDWGIHLYAAHESGRGTTADPAGTGENPTPRWYCSLQRAALEHFDGRAPAPPAALLDVIAPSDGDRVAMFATEVGFTIVPPDSADQQVHTDIFIHRWKNPGTVGFPHLAWKRDPDQATTTFVIPGAFGMSSARARRCNAEQQSAPGILFDAECAHFGGAQRNSADWSSTLTLQIATSRAWEGLSYEFSNQLVAATLPCERPTDTRAPKEQSTPRAAAQETPAEQQLQEAVKRWSAQAPKMLDWKVRETRWAMNQTGFCNRDDWKRWYEEEERGYLHQEAQLWEKGLRGPWELLRRTPTGIRVRRWVPAAPPRVVPPAAPPPPPPPPPDGTQQRPYPALVVGSGLPAAASAQLLAELGLSPGILLTLGADWHRARRSTPVVSPQLPGVLSPAAADVYAHPAGLAPWAPYVVWQEWLVLELSCHALAHAKAAGAQPLGWGSVSVSAEEHPDLLRVSILDLQDTGEEQPPAPPLRTIYCRRVLISGSDGPQQLHHSLLRLVGDTASTPATLTGPDDPIPLVLQPHPRVLLMGAAALTAQGLCPEALPDRVWSTERVLPAPGTPWEQLARCGVNAAMLAFQDHVEEDPCQPPPGLALRQPSWNEWEGWQ